MRFSLIKKDLDDLRLEPLSKRFARSLFEERPDWFQYAEARENLVDGLSVFTLELNFPSQNPAVPEPLTLDIDLGGIIGLRWFTLSSGYQWNVDWVMYMPSVWEVLPAEFKVDPDFGLKAAAQLTED